MYDKFYTVSRENMVHNQIITNKVKNENLIDAFLTVQKELFVPKSQISIVYSDSEIPFFENRSMMKTFLLAKLFELCDFSSNQSVLVIGCLSGYSVAIISKMAGYVFGLEDNNKLVTQANQTLSDIACHNCSVNFGKLSDGLKKNSPYDTIIIEGSVEKISNKVLEQVKEKGKIFTIFREKKSVIGECMVGIKIDGNVSFRHLFNANANLLEDFKNHGTQNDFKS